MNTEKATEAEIKELVAALLPGIKKQNTPKPPGEKPENETTEIEKLVASII